MVLWIDEDFASCIWSDSEHMHGFEQIRSGFAQCMTARPVTIELLDIRVYDSLGIVVYTVAEAHQYADGGREPSRVRIVVARIESGNLEVQ